MSDIDTALVDSLKVLDPERPIREAENLGSMRVFRILTRLGHQPAFHVAVAKPVSAPIKDLI